MAQIKPDDFCHWLWGFCELHGAPPTEAQWSSIKEHLALVFTKVTKPGPGEKVEPMYCATRIFDGSAAPDGGKACSTEQPNTLLTPSSLKMLDLLVDGPICGDGITIVGSDGSSEQVSWEEHNRRRTANHVYITVSRRPGYQPDRSYSYYPFHSFGDAKDKAAQEAFLNQIGVRWHNDEVYCVVDNGLEPRVTELNQLKGSQDHLTSLHPRSPGIVNVGVGEPLIC